MDNKLLTRTIVAFVVLLFSIIVFSPNVSSQELAVVFKKTHRDVKNEKQKNSKAKIKDYSNDRENGLLYFFPNSECKPTEGDGVNSDYRCVLKDRFITSARVNELIQTSPELINPRLTRVLPSSIEKFFGSFKNKASKNLKIKLGLDLQGGIRAVFRADFEAYLKRLEEKLGPYIGKLKKDLKSEKDISKQNQIRSEIINLENRLEVNTGQRLSLLQSVKDVIDKRLTAQNLTEPEIRVQEESFSVAIDIPGVANPNEVLDKIKDTVTVEYRIVNEEATEKVSADIENQDDLRKLQKLYRLEIVNTDDANDIFKE